VSSELTQPVEKRTGGAPQSTWLARALANPGVSHLADADGVPIHYLEWGSADGRPSLLFISGYRAHVRWWDCIAPLFADRFHLVVMELSGMGDSGRRSLYTPDCFARDIVAVAKAAQLQQPIGIAHSYGGARLLRACSDLPQLCSRAIVVDSYVHFADEGPVPEYPRIGSRRVYPTFAEARARFRLSPEQTFANTELADYVAAGSLRETEGGWTWKFDVDLPGGGPTELDGAALLSKVIIPVDYIYGEHSLVTNAARARRIVAALPQARQPIEIPDAHHHVMFDQPVATISVLQALLADYPQENC
jgi:pimeloyl-ACP methyl ester carboxylesterase